ncbi:hypothetical protein EPN29_14270 [bacterium]|nr:MAG: hypothetical protein EPN29_14270 [bacterium]
MLSGERGYDLRLDWARGRAFQVVPAESAARIPAADIPRLAAALKEFSGGSAIAVNIDVTDERGDAFDVQIGPEGLTEVNRELGLYRFLLTREDEPWAIACNEWYNLFAAPAELLTELLGGTLEEARAEFQVYADRLGGSLPDVAALYREPAS